MSEWFSSLTREFRRRRIGRLAVAYAVGAWVLIEVADVVFPRLGLPDSLVTLLIVIAIAGFPVALTLSWFFNVVPEDNIRSRRPSLVAAGAIGGVLLLTTVATMEVWPRLMDRPVDIRSVAVLPFDNLSGDPEQAYLAAGMHDALITELAQIGALRVLSRTSTLRYRNTERPLGEIADELNVDAVVEASVLRMGDQLRIQAQLISPRPTERHVWAEGYDRELRDVRTVHSEIARGVAEAIGAPLRPDEAERLAEARPVDPEAYEAYLRGMYFLNQQTSEGYEKGLRHLHEAVEIDPADPAAYAGLALGYSLIGHGTMPDKFERAKAAAARALALDSTNAAAHEALAEIALYRDWDWPTAEREFQRALALNPNLPEAAAHYGWYLDIKGQREDAVQLLERAESLDPLNPLLTAWSGWLVLDTDPETALRKAREALELDPHHPHALLVAATASATLGRRQQALEWADQLAAMPAFLWAAARVHAILGDGEDARRLITDLEDRVTPMNAFGLAVVYCQLDEPEPTMRWLHKAHRLRFSWMPWIFRPGMFDCVADHPDFEALLNDLDLTSPGPPAT